MNFCSDGALNSDSVLNAESVPLLKDGDEESVEHDSSKPDPVHDVGFFEKIHARYAPSRRLKNKFFDENVLVSLIYHQLARGQCRSRFKMQLV